MTTSDTTDTQPTWDALGRASWAFHALVMSAGRRELEWLRDFVEAVHIAAGEGGVLLAETIAHERAAGEYDVSTKVLAADRLVTAEVSARLDAPHEVRLVVRSRREIRLLRLDGYWRAEGSGGAARARLTLVLRDGTLVELGRSGGPQAEEAVASVYESLLRNLD